MSAASSFMHTTHTVLSFMTSAAVANYSLISASGIITFIATEWHKA